MHSHKEVVHDFEALDKNAQMLIFMHRQGSEKAIAILKESYEHRAVIFFGFVLHVALNLSIQTLKPCLGLAGEGISERELSSLFRFCLEIVRDESIQSNDRFKRLLPRTIP